MDMNSATARLFFLTVSSMADPNHLDELEEFVGNMKASRDRGIVANDDLVLECLWNDYAILLAKLPIMGKIIRALFDVEMIDGVIVLRPRRGDNDE